MPSLLAPLFATAEMAAVGWISTIPGLTADTVTTQLPSEDQWAVHGAITVLYLGGKPNPYAAYSESKLQVECWANNLGSDKVPWMRAHSIAMQVKLACLDRQFAQRTVPCSLNGVTYPGAAVRTVTAIADPRRIYNSPADYAGYMFDIAMTWSQAGLTTR